MDILQISSHENFLIGSLISNFFTARVCDQRFAKGCIIGSNDWVIFNADAFTNSQSIMSNARPESNKLFSKLATIVRLLGPLKYQKKKYCYYLATDCRDSKKHDCKEE